MQTSQPHINTLGEDHMSLEAAQENNNQMAYCSVCGAKMAYMAGSCPKCGAPNALAKEAVSNQTMLAAALLCFFLGSLGIHRFYVGKIGTGILMILTLGGLGIWQIIDFVRIIIGSFSDKQGLKLQR